MKITLKILKILIYFILKNIMVWGTLSFNNDYTDIYFDLTCPLRKMENNGSKKSLRLSEKNLFAPLFFLEKTFSSPFFLPLSMVPARVPSKYLSLSKRLNQKGYLRKIAVFNFPSVLSFIHESMTQKYFETDRFELAKKKL